MSNLIGEPFAPFVKSQVDLRQTSLGQYSNIDADSMKYYSSKTPFLRLASSVNVNDLKAGDETIMDTIYQKLIAKGYSPKDVYGDNLAKNLILFSGVTKAIDKKTQKETGEDGKETSFITSKYQGNARRQINYNSADKPLQGSYGWGGIDERGYVPMPGITSAQTTYYNNGALSKATVKLKCWSKAQFTLIDVLYLRPGYTLLLEFGWSVYLNSNADSNGDGVPNSSNAETGVSDLEIGTIQSMDGFKSAPLNFLLNPGEYKGNKDQYKMLKLIADERAKYSGNYEAVYGKITNFKWSFTTDGSYEVEVKLIGMGSIAESLKLNVTQPSKDKIGNVNENGTTPIKSNKKTYKAWLDDAIGPSAAMRVTEGIENVTSDEASGDSPLDKQLNSWPGSARTEMNQKTGGQLALDEKLADINVWAKAEFKKYQDEEEAVAVSNINNNPLLANRDDTKLNKIFYDVQQSAIAVMDRVGAGTDPDGNPATCSFFYTNGVSNGGFLINNTLTGDTMVGGGQKEGKSVYLKFAIVLKIIQEN